jgi:hypothetical protein
MRCIAVRVGAMPCGLLCRYPCSCSCATWLYGVFQMFDRRYVISADGVSLFRRERLLEHIAWSEVRSIRRGQLEIRARCGRRIAFNLPWRIQWRALDAIERYKSSGRLSTT